MTGVQVHGVLVDHRRRIGCVLRLHNGVVREAHSGPAKPERCAQKGYQVVPLNLHFRSPNLNCDDEGHLADQLVGVPCSALDPGKRPGAPSPRAAMRKMRPSCCVLRVMTTSR